MDICPIHGTQKSSGVGKKMMRFQFCKCLISYDLKNKLTYEIDFSDLVYFIFDESKNTICANILIDKNYKKMYFEYKFIDFINLFNYFYELNEKIENNLEFL